jgi:hypothetical protein
MNQCPIIFVIFKRPEQTASTFAAIRAARPARLLVVADGPRPDRLDEAKLCVETRSIIDGVDWPCEVMRNFSDTNLGCCRRVVSGLNWAFEHVEEAIVLEEDCLPHPSFFRFCTELLERYRRDSRIMMVSGNNFQNGASRTRDSYYFSQMPNVWGWATWRRAWRLCDFSMPGWPQRRETRWLKGFAKHPVLELHWQQSFDDVMAGKIDTWDYQWRYCMLLTNGLSIAPNVNLVTNIGVGHAATHTLTVDERYLVPSRAMDFPLRHPASVKLGRKADKFEQRYLYRLPRFVLQYRIYLALRPSMERLRPVLERTGLWAHLRALAIKLVG